MLPGCPFCGKIEAVTKWPFTTFSCLILLLPNFTIFLKSQRGILQLQIATLVANGHNIWVDTEVNISVILGNHCSTLSSISIIIIVGNLVTSVHNELCCSQATYNLYKIYPMLWPLSTNELCFDLTKCAIPICNKNHNSICCLPLIKVSIPQQILSTLWLLDDL